MNTNSIYIGFVYVITEKSDYLNNEEKISVAPLSTRLFQKKKDGYYDLETNAKILTDPHDSLLAKGDVFLNIDKLIPYNEYIENKQKHRTKTKVLKMYQEKTKKN